MNIDAGTGAKPPRATLEPRKGEEFRGASDSTLRSIVIFLVIAMSLSVAYFAVRRGLGGAARGAPTQSSDWLGALRGYGPTIAALLAAMVGTGHAGFRALLARLRAWRIERRLLLAAFALPVGVNLVVLMLMRLDTVVPLDLIPPQGARLYIAFFIFAIVDGPLGEELGWRGYLLPLLLARTSATRASLVVGLAWFAWHLPLYAADGRALTGEFLATYLVSVVSVAMIFTWFFVRSNGNVWLAVLLHTTTNYFQYATVTLFPSLRGTVVDNRAYVALMALVAIGLAYDLRRERGTSWPVAYRPTLPATKP